MPAQVVIRFMTDQNVPNSVVLFLQERGHDVVRSREVVGAEAKDPVVATAAMEANRILIAWDKDFHHQRQLGPRYERLARIGMNCPEPDGRRRLEENIDRVEFEYMRVEGQPIRLQIGRDRYLALG